MAKCKVGLLLVLAAQLPALHAQHASLAKLGDACLTEQLEARDDADDAAMLQVTQGSQEAASAQHSSRPALLGRLVAAAEEKPWWISYSITFVAIALLTILPLSLTAAEKAEKRWIRVNIFKLVAYYLWLFGGLWVFVWHVHFVSAHFTGERPLEFPEAVYLMIQVVLTIGYGDITPASEKGRLLMAFYIVLSLFVVADLLGTVCGIVVSRLEDLEAITLETLAEVTSPTAARAARQDDEVEEQVWYTKPQPKLPWNALISSISGFLALLVVGSCLQHYANGQRLNWMDSIYMCVVTASTVGFGDFTETTRIDQALGSLWMLLGVAGFANMGVHFATFMSAVQTRDCRAASEAVRNQKLQEDLANIKADQLDANAFLRLSLQQSGIATEAEIAQIDKLFAILADGSGKVSKDKLLSGCMVPAAKALPCL